MKKKKYKRIRNTKYKILNRNKANDSVVFAARLAIEAALGAMQLQIMLSSPVPKFESGGVSSVKEAGPEMICGYEPLKGAKMVTISRDQLNKIFSNETTQKH